MECGGKTDFFGPSFFSEASLGIELVMTRVYNLSDSKLRKPRLKLISEVDAQFSFCRGRNGPTIQGRSRLGLSPVWRFVLIWKVPL